MHEGAVGEVGRLGWSFVKVTGVFCENVRESLVRIFTL